MNEPNVKLEAQISLDKNVSPGYENSLRGLLVEVVAKGEKAEQSRSVNLCLVIDRSGSMRGENMNAAKAAARGVVERLNYQDYLSVVSFDNEVSLMLEGICMDESGRAKAITAIAELRSRGTTDLGAGWFKGAQAVSEVIECTNFETGHIVVISDGYANKGLTDPKELSKHAAELAQRGVTTSTVGIGHYSPLQLDALAEGGQGRIHDAGDSSRDLVDVLMGELHDTMNVIAKDVVVNVDWPTEVDAELVSHFPTRKHANGMQIILGRMMNGSRRHVPLLLKIPALGLGSELEFKVSVSGEEVGTGKKLESHNLTTCIAIVGVDQVEMAECNESVVEKIADLYQGKTGFDALRENASGRYEEAERTVRKSMDDLFDFTRGTSIEKAVNEDLEIVATKVRGPLNERKLREAIVGAKKDMRGEREHKSAAKKWQEHI